MTPKEKARLDKVERLIESLIKVENLEFSKKLERILNVTVYTSSNKTVDSEDVTINEGGVATKTALSDPDGWLKLGTNQNIPIYND